MAKKKAQPPKEKISKVDNLAEGGFYNCTLVKLVKGADGNTQSFGEGVGERREGRAKGSIRAMHESNIDEYNTQQLNSGMFIRKDGVDYKLESLFAKGRVSANGEPKPYKVFVEVKK